MFSDNRCTDNIEADEQQTHSEFQLHSSSTATGTSHPSITTPNVQYATPQLGVNHPVVIYVEWNLFSLLLLFSYIFRRINLFLLFLHWYYIKPICFVSEICPSWQEKKLCVIDYLVYHYVLFTNFYATQKETYYSSTFFFCLCIILSSNG